MLYRSDDQKYFLNGELDDTKLLKDIENFNDSITALYIKISNLHNELSNAQHDIILALSGEINSNRARGLNKTLEKIMCLKQDIEQIQNRNIFTNIIC